MRYIRRSREVLGEGAMHLRKGRIIFIAVTTSAVLAPTAASAFKYEYPPPMVAKMTPMDAAEPSLYVPGMRQTANDGAFGEAATALLRHPGVLQCFSDGGAILVEPS